jgi:hypothetical protein
MEECSALEGHCNWIGSNWTRKSVATGNNLPLLLSGKEITEII